MAGFRANSDQCFGHGILFLILRCADFKQYRKYQLARPDQALNEDLNFSHKKAARKLLFNSLGLYGLTTTIT